MRKIRKNINKLFRKAVDIRVKASKGKIINISSINKGISGSLSNFTKAPFILDGIRYESFEGFWQSLKFPKNSLNKEKARQLYGIKAKKIAKDV